MAINKTENKVLFIYASKEFKKETNNNILEEKNINTINEVENIYETNKIIQLLYLMILHQEIIG